MKFSKHFALAALTLSAIAVGGVSFAQTTGRATPSNAGDPASQRSQTATPATGTMGTTDTTRTDSMNRGTGTSTDSMNRGTGTRTDSMNRGTGMGSSTDNFNERAARADRN